MADIRETKKQRVKKGQSKDNSNPISRTTKRKTLKNATGNDQYLKANIIKQFRLLNKQEANQKELRVVLLGLGFSSWESRKAITDFKNMEPSKYQFSPNDVLTICTKFPQREKWRKQCFELFSKNKDSVNLQDLEGFWDELRKKKIATIPHESLVMMIRDQGNQLLASLSPLDFDKLLMLSNTFCE